ncbi:MAG: hypothetical protein D6706_03905 [Chloroflexi bacterium]|nr:MAG: hypothetical protein D6706_03905 [Chloroflexota bacterium]
MKFYLFFVNVFRQVACDYGMITRRTEVWVFNFHLYGCCRWLLYQSEIRYPKPFVVCLFAFIFNNLAG